MWQETINNMNFNMNVFLSYAPKGPYYNKYSSETSLFKLSLSNSLVLLGIALGKKSQEEFL